MKSKKRIFALVLSLCLAIGAAAFAHGLTTSASSNGREIYNLLTTKYGFNGAQASGILANIYYESGFNPNAGGTCYGLVQWTGARKSAMRRYAGRLGYSGSSVKGQVAYLVHELKTSERAAYSRIKAASNTSSGAYTSGYAFCYYFERPANKLSRSRQRGSKARSFFASYNGSKSTGKTSKSTSSTSSKANTAKTYKAGTYKLRLTMTLRAQPSISSKAVGSIAKGKTVKVTTIKNKKWAAYKTNGKTRYFSLKYATKVA